MATVGTRKDNDSRHANNRTCGETKVQAKQTSGRTFHPLLVLSHEDLLKGQRLGPHGAILGLRAHILMCFHKFPQALSFPHLDSDSRSPS